MAAGVHSDSRMVHRSKVRLVYPGFAAPWFVASEGTLAGR